MDHEFIEGIRQQVLNELEKAPKSCRDLKEVAQSVHGTARAWSRMEDSLGLSDFRSITATLMYDGLIEECRTSGRSAADASDTVYMLVGQPRPLNALAAVPCGSCPVRHSLRVVYLYVCLLVCLSVCMRALRVRVLGVCLAVVCVARWLTSVSLAGLSRPTLACTWMRG